MYGPISGVHTWSGGSLSNVSPKISGVRTEEVHEAAQVCALQWSRHEKEILSSHGFSQNQLCLWKYPSMAKVCPLVPECTMAGCLHPAAPAFCCRLQEFWLPGGRCVGPTEARVRRWQGTTR